MAESTEAVSEPAVEPIPVSEPVVEASESPKKKKKRKSVVAPAETPAATETVDTPAPG